MFAEGTVGIIIAVALPLGLVIYWLSLRLSDSLRRQAATNDVLRLVGNSAVDVETVLATLLKTSVEICRADAAAIVRPKATGENDVAHTGLPDKYLDHMRHMALAARPDTLIGRTMREGRTIRILDACTDASLAGSLERQYFRSWLGIPLILEGNTVAVLVLARSTPSLSAPPGRPTNVTSRLMWSRNLPFSDDEVEVVTTFAQHATFALENARLFNESKEQQRQLELANSYKSRFFAAASHDLRQPLHALNLFLAQLQDCNDPAKRQAVVDSMSTAVASMNDLFDALMDVSKLDAGLLEPAITQFPVALVLARVEATLAPAALKKGLRLRLVTTRCFARSDFILLERIVLNLLSNAIQYTDTGGVVVGVRRRGSALRIDVCDTGSGISDADQQAVFGEFFQVQKASGRQPKSLGLGLSIVDRLARLLGHGIELESIPGRGSRFSVYVPVAEATAPDLASPPASRPGSIANVASVAGRQIIVIEDDPLVRSGMVTTLQSWGCIVAAADTESKALQTTSAWATSPDLIISDYHLGHAATGIDAISRLRFAFDEDIPAFLISGDTSPERLHEARANNLFILPKPMSPMALRSMLTRLLRERAGIHSGLLN